MALRVALLFVCAILLPAGVGATVIVPLSDQELAEQATAVVIGRVVSLQGAYDAYQAKVFTDIRLSLDDVLTANIQSAEITIRQLGGTAGHLVSHVEGSPEFYVGEKVLLFLRQRRDGSLRVAHLYQGKFSISSNPDSGEEFAHRSVPSGVTRLIRREQGNSAPVPPHDVHSLAEFRDRIRSFIRDGRSQLLQGDTAAEVATDTGAEYESFTYLNPTSPTRWFEPDTGISVPIQINSAGEPLAPGGGFDQVRQALQAWSTVSGSTFRFHDAGFTSEGGFRSDGVNAVSFRDPDGEIDPPVGCGGTLAIGGYFATSTQRTINGQVFRQIFEGDVVFADGWAGCGFYETFSRLAEVATHELGHVLGLGHSTDSTATMYSVAHFDSRGASLRGDDKNGLRAIYPPFTLTVSTTGSGGGTLSSTPAGIDCGTTCSADFNYNASVTLTATPMAGSTFGGWSGACTGTGSCSVTMTQTRVVTATFTLAATPPAAATLIAPAGSIATATPTYTWSAVPTATWYYVWVNDVSGSGKLRQWTTAAGAGCATGTGTCSVTASTVLAPGSATWWVQTWNDLGYGPWSSAMTFDAPALGPPPTITGLTNPAGTIGTSLPTYTWTAAPTATWYFLWVNDSTGNRIQQWYPASTLGCTAGTCNAIPGTTLASGGATWWVQAWNPAGYGSWCAGQAFIVAP